MHGTLTTSRWMMTVEAGAAGGDLMDSNCLVFAAFRLRKYIMMSPITIKVTPITIEMNRNMNSPISNKMTPRTVEEFMRMTIVHYLINIEQRQIASVIPSRRLPKVKRRDPMMREGMSDL